MVLRLQEFQFGIELVVPDLLHQQPLFDKRLDKAITADDRVMQQHEQREQDVGDDQIVNTDGIIIGRDVDNDTRAGCQQYGNPQDLPEFQDDGAKVVGANDYPIGIDDLVIANVLLS